MVAAAFSGHGACCCCKEADVGSSPAIADDVSTIVFTLAKLWTSICCAASAAAPPLYDVAISNCAAAIVAFTVFAFAVSDAITTFAIINRRTDAVIETDGLTYCSQNQWV